MLRIVDANLKVGQTPMKPTHSPLRGLEIQHRLGPKLGLQLKQNPLTNGGQNRFSCLRLTEITD